RRRPAVAALAACICLALAGVGAAVALQVARQRAHDAAVADLAGRERQRAREAEEHEGVAREARERAAQEAYGRRFPAAAGRWQAAVTPDGRHLALLTGAGPTAHEVQVREVASGRTVGRRAPSGRPGYFDLTSRPAGLLAAYVGTRDSGGDGVAVRLWD